jgi:NADPH2:quinone reductase
MKAAVYYQNGGPEIFRYEQVPDPVCSPDGVLIKIAAISIEGGDLIHREIRPLVHTPHIVGYQCAGEIIEVGSQVTNRNIGQRVVTILEWGSHAEIAAAPAADTWLVPDKMDLDTAAAIPVAFGTASECLFTFGNLQKGQTVLVHAAAGALGLAVVQLAKRAGTTVFAAASSDAKLDRLNEFGVDFPINHTKRDFVEAVKEHTEGRGVDLVVDSLAGKNLTRSVAALKYRGRAIVVGVSGRDAEQFDPIALWKGCNSLHGVYFPSLLPHEHDRNFAAVDRLIHDIARGDLRVVIDSVFPFAEVTAAYEFVLSRKAFGRVLLRP